MFYGQSYAPNYFLKDAFLGLYAKNKATTSYLLA